MKSHLDNPEPVSRTYIERIVFAESERSKLGLSSITDTARKAVDCMCGAKIPYVICGGLAVQHYGYARYTSDVDIIVYDVYKAVQALKDSGFKETQYYDALTDSNGVRVDLMQGGQKLRPNSRVACPDPGILVAGEAYVSLEELISLKLDARRDKDIADVGELIKINGLPKDFPVEDSVKDLYCAKWDGTTLGGDYNMKSYDKIKESCRDDINKLPMPRSGKKYARRHGKDIMHNFSQYSRMVADITGDEPDTKTDKDVGIVQKV